MVGGGRCTKAGCFCYESFFVGLRASEKKCLTDPKSEKKCLKNVREMIGEDPDFGKPTSIIVPQDNIWYELGSNETEQIKEATIRHFKQPNATQYMCEKE